MCNEPVSWPKEFSSLQQLDSLLKCGICYDYFKNAIITPCSHNYCSYCIRKSLLYKSQCPACFEETNESQLRNNRVLDEFIIIFTGIRDRLIKCLVNSNGLHADSLRTETNQNMGYKEDTCRVTTRVESSESSSSTSFAQQNYSVQHVLSKDSNAFLPSCEVTPKKRECIPAMFSPKKQNDTAASAGALTVSCPVCAVAIPERNINLHLDACLRRAEQGVETRGSKCEKRKPMPKLVYTLLHEKVLRKKLSDLGLSTLGDRKTLVNRHKRFTLLYNSECDSLNPRPVSKLIQQIEKEEQEEKKVSRISPQTIRLNVDRKADPKAIEEAQQHYLQQHKRSFDGLIQSIRNRGAMKRDLLENRVEEEENEDNADDPVIVITSSSSEKTNSDEESDVHPRSNRALCSRKFSTSEDESNVVEDVMRNKESTESSDPPCTSPVLVTRCRLHTTPSASRITSTPDMFDERDVHSDDSNGSISLMTYHVEDASLDVMPQSTYIGQEEVEVVKDASLDSIPQSTYAVQGQGDVEVKKDASLDIKLQSPNVAQEGVEKLESTSSEVNLESGFQPVNFDFDIESLLVSAESQTILPIRRQSKRKTSAASTSNEEVTTQRVLRKRVKH